MKPSELIGPALDWAVAKSEGHDWRKGEIGYCYSPAGNTSWQQWNPATNWSQGGPIIERERITLKPEWDGEKEYWTAISITRFEHYRAVCSGPTPLIAAMRCFVMSKLGDEVDIPEELLR